MWIIGPKKGLDIENRGCVMSQLFSYAAITGFCTLIFDAIILLFRTEKVERILLNERKKFFLDFTRVVILGFCISLVLYGYLKNEPSMENPYAYSVTFVMSLILSVEVYYSAISLMNDFGYGKNYFIEDEQHGKLYLMKNSKEKYILLADKPRIKDSKFVIFKDGSVIENIKIYSEPKKYSSNSGLNSNTPQSSSDGGV